MNKKKIIGIIVLIALLAVLVIIGISRGRDTESRLSEEYSPPEPQAMDPEASETPEESQMPEATALPEEAEPEAEATETPEPFEPMEFEDGGDLVIIVPEGQDSGGM